MVTTPSAHALLDKRDRQSSKHGKGMCIVSVALNNTHDPDRNRKTQSVKPSCNLISSIVDANTLRSTIRIDIFDLAKVDIIIRLIRKWCNSCRYCTCVTTGIVR